MKKPQVNFKRPDLKSLDLAALWRGLVRPESGVADRVVPPTGFTAQLTLFAAGAMAFLAVFALALALATGRLADRWSESLAQTVTVRISAPTDQMEKETSAVVEALKTTPGVGKYEVVSDEEVEKLLEPWFGPDVPVDALPVPKLIEVTQTPEFDSEALQLRLQAEAPNAIVDDHTRWRKPLVSAANRLKVLGLFSLLLIAATSGVIITLAAKAALAANGPVLRVLRLIGARDITIATAFVRRFTRRAAIGSGVGTIIGLLAIFALPSMNQAGGFLTGLGFQGFGWLVPLLIPVISALIAFFATRWAALKILRGVR